MVASDDPDARPASPPFGRYLAADPLALAEARKGITLALAGLAPLGGSRLLDWQPRPLPRLTPPVGKLESPEPSAQEAEHKAPETELSWIEIQLFDEDGEPMKGEKYRVELPDGSQREGKLDGAGRARLDDIPPGACQVAFPELRLPPAGRN